MCAPIPIVYLPPNQEPIDLAILLYLAFVALTVLKLMGIIAVSWWIVVLPLAPIAIAAILAFFVCIWLALSSD